MKIPRIIIAGTNSGCGKTTITTGIMAALLNRGLKVQPYKIGPDYIDPMLHTFITGRNSRNLDSWLLEEEVLKYLFQKNFKDADIGIIEGVMGFYDGFGGINESGSTCHVGKILKAPVILIVNGDGMSLSIAAIIKGFVDFDKNANIVGVIINNINSQGHYDLLKNIILEYTNIIPLGYLSKLPELTFESRHLGLIPAGEVTNLKHKIKKLALEIEKTISIDEILKLSTIKSKIETINRDKFKFKINEKVRIGFAKDKAFNFYYQDNLDLLEELGAELIPFSPLYDNKLPENLEGIYIGGGYPEVFGKELSENISFKKSILEEINKGIPGYAECGGLMYLSDSITNHDNEKFNMVGGISGETILTKSLKRFGYANLEIIEESPIGKKGLKSRIHEFHFSDIINTQKEENRFLIWKESKGKVITKWKCGYQINNFLGGYPHIHFWSNLEIPKEFIKSCLKYKAGGK